MTHEPKEPFDAAGWLVVGLVVTILVVFIIGIVKAA